MVASDNKKETIIKYSSLVVLVLQNTSLVLFMRYAMTGNRPKFLKAISVFYGEIFKLFASIVLVCCGAGSVRRGLSEIYNQFVHHWRDAVKVLVPAVVYTIQNFLLYVAVDNLPAATYMVTYQLKILTTAMFTVLVLKRKLSIQQWIALLFLFIGVVVVQYDTKKDSLQAAKLAETTDLPTTVVPKLPELPEGSEDGGVSPTLETAFNDLMNTMAPGNETVRVKRESGTKKDESPIFGFIAVLVACCMSGFAGIYFEKILKGSDVSIWIRNIQLALPSIFFALLFAFVKDNNEIFGDGINPGVVFDNMMKGFDWAVWVTVAISAFGGLVVAVVIKYADNILKAFATSFAIVLNCILAYFLFDFKPSILFLVGAALVIGAVFVYSMYPYRAPHQPLPTTETDAEMAEIKKKESA